MKYYLVNETSFQTGFISVYQPLKQKLCQAWNILGCRKFAMQNNDWGVYCRYACCQFDCSPVRFGFSKLHIPSTAVLLAGKKSRQRSTGLENCILEQCARLLLNRNYLAFFFNFVFKRPRWNLESVGTVRFSDGWAGIEFLSLFLTKVKLGLSISFLNSSGSFCRSKSSSKLFPYFT